MRTRNGSTFLEVLIAMAVFSAVFPFVIRAFTTAALVTGTTGLRSAVVREAHNEMVRLHLPDSDLTGARAHLNRKPVGWKDVRALPGIRIRDADLVRRIEIEKLSGNLYEVHLVYSWDEKRPRKPQQFRLQAVLDL